MRILLEAATESEWVAQNLETLGHEVIVADTKARVTEYLDRVEESIARLDVHKG